VIADFYNWTKSAANAPDPLRSRRLAEHNQEIHALWAERRITLFLALLFLLLNVALVWRALAIAPNPNRLQIFEVGD
jgi:hypothetical protein